MICINSKKGMERNAVLLWTSALLMVAIVSFLILPKLVQSGRSISTTETCALYTVRPVSCSLLNGDARTPWRANVQLTEPLDPNIKGELLALRAYVGAAYTDIRKGAPEFSSSKQQQGLIRLQIIGTSNGSAPLNAQALVDSIYALPGGDTTHCRSLPLTCSP